MQVQEHASAENIYKNRKTFSSTEKAHDQKTRANAGAVRAVASTSEWRSSSDLSVL